MMDKQKVREDSLSEAEASARSEAVLKRLLSTPPQPKRKKDASVESEEARSANEKKKH